MSLNLAFLSLQTDQKPCIPFFIVLHDIPQYEWTTIYAAIHFLYSLPSFQPFFLLFVITRSAAIDTFLYII